MCEKFLRLAAGLLVIFMFSSDALSQEKEAFKYGGVKTCKACHMSKKSGAQYKVWQTTSHAKAFETLNTPEAKAAAKEMGIEDPASSDKCLKCHVTAYTVDASLKGPKLKLEDGVSCESCHGPGSGYKKKATMTGIWKNELKAEDYGLIKPVTEKVCVTCHNEESPTFKKFVFEEMVAKIAHPIPEK